MWDGTETIKPVIWVRRKEKIFLKQRIDNGPKSMAKGIARLLVVQCCPVKYRRRSIAALDVPP
jgi:hypothetical protein